MKQLWIAISGAALLGTAPFTPVVAQTAAAQTDGPYARMAVLRPHDGKTVDFEAGYIRHLEWHRQARDTVIARNETRRAGRRTRLDSTNRRTHAVHAQLIKRTRRVPADSAASRRSQDSSGAVAGARWGRPRLVCFSRRAAAGSTRRVACAANESRAPLTMSGPLCHDERDSDVGGGAVRHDNRVRVERTSL